MSQGHGDTQLVRHARDGRPAAFGELYDRYAALIRAVCFDGTLDHEAARDCTQEAFLRALTRLERLSEPDKFGSWLVGIARMVCREWRRKRDRLEGSAGLELVGARRTSLPTGTISTSMTLLVRTGVSARVKTWAGNAFWSVSTRVEERLFVRRAGSRVACSPWPPPFWRGRGSLPWGA